MISQHARVQTISLNCTQRCSEAGLSNFSFSFCLNSIPLDLCLFAGLSKFSSARLSHFLLFHSNLPALLNHHAAIRPLGRWVKKHSVPFQLLQQMIKYKRAGLLHFSSDVSFPYLRSRHLLKQPSKNFLIRQLRHSKSSCWWPTQWQAKTPSTFGAETTGHQLICINWNLRTKGFI